MNKFIKFLGKAHINGMNIAMYNDGMIKLENVINGNVLAALQFTSPIRASDWFESLGGNNTSKTIEAIEILQSLNNNHA